MSATDSTTPNLRGPLRLFHFSDDPHIRTFTPRPIHLPVRRPAGQEWLNEALVWAIDERHQAMYLFPRECPRILVWKTPATAPQDAERWWAGRQCRAIAHIEWTWFDRLKNAALHRYELPIATFWDIGDAGMWVTASPVVPMGIATLRDLPAELRAQGVELRIMESLAPLKSAWETSLHVSGIRLRNAQHWESAAGAGSAADAGSAFAAEW